MGEIKKSKKSLEKGLEILKDFYKEFFEDRLGRLEFDDILRTLGKKEIGATIIQTEKSGLISLANSKKLIYSVLEQLLKESEDELVFLQKFDPNFLAIFFLEKKPQEQKDPIYKYGKKSLKEKNPDSTVKQEKPRSRKTILKF